MINRLKKLLVLAMAIMLLPVAAQADVLVDSQGDAWYFGFGQCDIVPDQDGDDPLYIAGYNSGLEITGVLDLCQARAVWIDTGGEGVLLIGESGVGKSEAAVELLKRGHRMIADDAVEIRKISDDLLMGTAPALIRDYVELRGIGIINVAKLFGMGAVKLENQINLVVNVVPWNTQKVYDRLGLEEQHMEILGVKIPMNTIPITPGRNLAVILEVAAMNNRQRKMGYNAALEFTEQMNRHFDEQMGK